MGFQVLDVTPIASYGPTPTSPPGKAELHKLFRVSRTDTAAGIVKAVLPAQVSAIAFIFYGSVNSDAGTTATVTITMSNNSGVVSTGTIDVKANGATTGFVQMSNLPNLQPVPLTGDLKITAQYAETGTAGTTGGPWNIVVAYVQ